MSQATTIGESLDQEDLSHNYIEIVDAETHEHKLTPDLVQEFSRNYTKPVVFRGMVKFDQSVSSSQFLEVETDQKLSYRERASNSAVTFRNERGKTDFNYVSGKVGPAQEFIHAIFDQQKDVYAHLGRVSAGYKQLHTYPWGETIFEHISKEVHASGWYQIPQWELSGQAFIGNNTEMYGEPSSGAPGSDWHMFPTVNIFVSIAGKKKWMIRPPQDGDHLKNHEELIFPSGGRENPVEDREFDTVVLEPGDVLFNVPFEWHKVLNAKGPSLAAAFRVIDREYCQQLMSLPAIQSNLKLRKMSDYTAHLITSLRLTSNDPVRMKMVLNTCEMMVCTAARFDV